jgi:hypothetical protein
LLFKIPGNSQIPINMLLKTGADDEKIREHTPGRKHKKIR